MPTVRFTRGLGIKRNHAKSRKKPKGENPLGRGDSPSPSGASSVCDPFARNRSSRPGESGKAESIGNIYQTNEQHYQKPHQNSMLSKFPWGQLFIGSRNGSPQFFFVIHYKPSL